MIPKKEFKVNHFITLRLENDKTNIYVNNQFFSQCKFLSLNINYENISPLNDIKSIDEIYELQQQSPKKNLNKKYSIPPTVKFWAHCSNFQVWVENNYNTHLLHHKLAFPLLYKLTKLGDPITKHVLEKEIMRRYLYGNSTVRIYLVIEGYLEYISSNKKIFRRILQISREDQLLELIRYAKEEDFQILLKKPDSNFLQVILNFPKALINVNWSAIEEWEILFHSSLKMKRRLKKILIKIVESSDSKIFGNLVKLRWLENLKSKDLIKIIEKKKLILFKKYLML